MTSLVILCVVHLGGYERRVLFGIPDYGELNPWLNEFYAPYLNTKFSYRPSDPRSDFAPLPEALDPSEVFRTRETRLARGCSISYRRTVYMMVDGNGVLLEAPDDTRLDVHVDAITEELYVERAGKRWACMPVARREGTGFSDIQDRRALQRLLSEMQCDGAVREGCHFRSTTTQPDNVCARKLRQRTASKGTLDRHRKDSFWRYVRCITSNGETLG